jgi:hypothetical protein
MARWTGPALVGIFRRDDSIDQVRADLRRVLDMKFEQYIDLGHRSVMLQLSSAWFVFQLIAPPEFVIRKIENFVKTHLPKDPLVNPS